VSVNPEILRYFDYEHLPEHLQEVSKPAGLLAREMIETLGNSHPELHEGLRKLLEAKDCFVRAALDVDSQSFRLPGK
jgi:hypothetical protein